MTRCFLCSHSQVTDVLWLSWVSFGRMFSRSVFMTNRMRKFYSCCVVHYVKYVQKKGTAERVSNPHMDDKTPGSCFGPVKMQLEHVTPCETTACLCCITDVCDSAESRQRTGVSWTWHLDSGSESGCSHRLKMQFCIFAL